MGLFKKHIPPEGISQREFECKRDELTIRGTEYRPAGENLPVAIVCHGFMAFQDTVKQYAIKLATLGYAAYCFDFCGGSVIKGKSDGATTAMSVLTEIRDLEAVIEYAQSLSGNGKELLLMGASQGGFVSALTAAKHPGLVEKLVLLYPALCIPDDARAGKMMFAKFDPNNIPEKLRCGPMKLGKCYVADVIGLDPFEEIKVYEGPVLIIHGTKDSIVNIDYARRAEKCYTNAKLHIIEKARHGFRGKIDLLALEYLSEFARR
ncbi:MAG: alpha/beta hydrolase [Ruminococcaceae bacterium]|nr:alpha/beta hydrolase [Oscillospiraceae bacterium]